MNAMCSNFCLFPFTLIAWLIQKVFFPFLVRCRLIQRASLKFRNIRRPTERMVYDTFIYLRNFSFGFSIRCSSLI